MVLHDVFYSWRLLQPLGLCVKILTILLRKIWSIVPLINVVFGLRFGYCVRL
uniref:Uncharacterized protein n=1 Tax=Anguilla anguilla TaxID=7936 RepID=A0A0E9SGZ4_ANGAN